MMGNPATRLARLPDGQMLVSVARAATILDVTPRHVRNLIATAELVAVDVSLPGSKRPRWATTRESLAAYVALATKQGTERIEIHLTLEDFRPLEDA